MEHALKTYRRANGITLEALARLTGLSKPHLSLVENGRPAGRRTIERLVAVTGLPVGVFFTVISATLDNPIAHSSIVAPPLHVVDGANKSTDPAQGAADPPQNPEFSTQGAM